MIDSREEFLGLTIYVTTILVLCGVVCGILVWLGLDKEENNLPTCYCEVLTPDFEPNYVGVPKHEPGCLYLDHDILMWYFMSEGIRNGK